MADDLIILDGTTFFCTSGNGDMDREASEGFFYMDVRHLSRWRLAVDGQEIAALSAGRVD